MYSRPTAASWVNDSAADPDVPRHRRDWASVAGTKARHVHLHTAHCTELECPTVPARWSAPLQAERRSVVAGRQGTFSSREGEGR